MITTLRRCVRIGFQSENGRLTLYYAYDFTEVKIMHRQVRRRRSSLLTWHRVGSR
jgi:hypothetical protein